MGKIERQELANLLFKLLVSPGSAEREFKVSAKREDKTWCLLQTVDCGDDIGTVGFHVEYEPLLEKLSENVCDYFVNNLCKVCWAEDDDVNKQLANDLCSSLENDTEVIVRVVKRPWSEASKIRKSVYTIN